MPRVDVIDGVSMTWPDDFLETTIDGVRLMRVSDIRDRGEYVARVVTTGVRYVVASSSHPRKFRWRICQGGREVAAVPTLVAAARWIARSA